MYSCKVLKTTDGKHRGMTFTVPEIDVTRVAEYTGGKFQFDKAIWLSETKVRLVNSNYSAIMKITEI